MKRTLKRELKAREIDIGEAVVKVAYCGAYSSVKWLRKCGFRVLYYGSNESLHGSPYLRAVCDSTVVLRRKLV